MKNKLRFAKVAEVAKVAEIAKVAKVAKCCKGGKCCECCESQEMSGNCDKKNVQNENGKKSFHDEIQQF